MYSYVSYLSMVPYLDLLVLDFVFLMVLIEY